jgi:hypothetical protein
LANLKTNYKSKGWILNLVGETSDPDVSSDKSAEKTTKHEKLEPNRKEERKSNQTSLVHTYWNNKSISTGF